VKACGNSLTVCNNFTGAPDLDKFLNDQKPCSLEDLPEDEKQFVVSVYFCGTHMINLR